jgi:hypothetical protein
MVMDALKGAVAGAVGVWVMDRVDWFNFEHEDPASRRLTQLVRPRGLDPAQPRLLASSFPRRSRTRSARLFITQLGWVPAPSTPLVASIFRAVAQFEGRYTDWVCSFCRTRC